VVTGAEGARSGSIGAAHRRAHGRSGARAAAARRRAAACCPGRLQLRCCPALLQLIRSFLCHPISLSLLVRVHAPSQQHRTPIPSCICTLGPVLFSPAPPSLPTPVPPLRTPDAGHCRTSSSSAPRLRTCLRTAAQRRTLGHSLVQSLASSAACPLLAASHAARAHLRGARCAHQPAASWLSHPARGPIPALSEQPSSCVSALALGFPSLP
jgi:hypothetical protein